MTYRKNVLAASLLLAGLAMSGGVNASNMWVGTADYTNAGTSAGDEDVVGPFDTYDFAPGVSLLKVTSTDGNGDPLTLAGYFQSYTIFHALDGNLAANQSGLNTNYEVTVWAEYTATSLGYDSLGNLNFTVDGGTVGLDFDTTPDKNFNTDSGFKNGVNSSDGETILSGTIGAGSEGVIKPSGSGFAEINLGIQSSWYNQAVFDPDTIAGASGIFNLKITTTGVFGGVSAVLGQSIGTNDILETADGYFTLATPIPAALWLFGSGLAGIAMISRRRRETEVFS